MSLIQGCLSRTTTTAAEIQIARAEQAPGWEAGDADMDAARAEHLPADVVVTTTEDRRRLEAECDEATRDVLLKASVLVDMADRGFDIEARHLDALRGAVHRRDAAITAKRAAREHRSNS
jgi:hypothetical protein